MKLFFAAIIALALLASPTSAKGPADYSLMSLYQFHMSDSLVLQNAVGFAFGKYLGHSKFVWEYQRDFIPFVRFRGRGNKDRVASTVLVMGCELAIPAWIMAIAGCSEEQINRMAMLLMAPFGSHLGYRPNRRFTIYAGVVPDVILFTENDGILVKGHVGARLEFGGCLAMNVGVAKTGLFAFKHAGGSFPIGVSLGVSFVPPGGNFSD